jgi:cold shock CspA family protein
MELARLHQACNRPAAALRQVERALACRRDNTFPEGLRLAAELAHRAGRIDEAIRYLEQLALLTPEDGTAANRALALAQLDTAPAASSSDAPLPAALAILDDATLEVPAQDRLVGIVDRFFEDKGFGFLQYDRGQSIFFHITQCEDGTQTLAPGTRVTFRVGHNPKKGKPQAETLRRID